MTVSNYVKLKNLVKNELSGKAFRQWQFLASAEQLGPSVKACLPLAHGDHAMVQTSK